MKHTPGPWHPGIGNGEGFIFAGNGRMRLNRNGGTTLYSVCRPTTGYDTAEDDANAQLIAAAPETRAELDRLKVQRDALLAACKAAVAVAENLDSPWWMDDPGRGGIDVPQLEAAIAACEPPGE